MNKIILVLFISLLIFYGCGGSSNELDEGNIAPDFTLEDSYGESHTLSSYRSQSPVVIYFYPKAGTAGCTKEACGIRDDYSDFKKNNIVVLGISVDSKEEIKEFIDENNLNFPLLSDEKKEVVKKYNVLNFTGLAKRVTFIIDKKGVINKIIKDVDVDTHAEEAFTAAYKLI